MQPAESIGEIDARTTWIQLKMECQDEVSTALEMGLKSDGVDGFLRSFFGI